MRTFLSVLAVLIWIVVLIALPVRCSDQPGGADSTESAPY